MKKNNYLLKTLTVCTMISGSCGALQAQGVALDWAKQATSTGDYNNGNAIVTDAAGNIYTCGRFSGTADFDPGPATFNMTAEGVTDIFMMKQDAAGQLLWAKKIGTTSPNTNQAVSMAIDASGNIYITGIYGATTDFDPGPGITYLNFGGGWNDAFIAKFDAAGSFVWAKAYSGIADESGSDIAVDNAGNVYACGNFSGTVDFDPGPGVFNMTAAQVAGYVTKLDAAGNFIWARKLDGAGSYLAGGMAVSPSGNVYLIGSVLDDAIDADPGAGIASITPEGFIDACVIKLDNNGNFGWVKQIGGFFSMAFGLKIAVDAQENIFPAGVYAGGIDFSSAPSMSLSSNATEDIFLAKLDAAGNFLWTKSTAGNTGALTELYTLQTDAGGNLYTGGFFKNTVDFDPGAGIAGMSAIYNGADVANGFFMKLDNAGNFKWAKQIAGPGESFCRGIAADGSGNIYATGCFKDTSDFDPGAGVTDLYTTGKDHIFVARYSCADTNSSVLTERNGKCSGYEFNGVTYNESGIYHIVFRNAAGCDSTVTLDLTIAGFEAAITVSGFTLHAASAYTTYQWLKDGNEINGATGDSYLVTENGDYSLVATNEDGCTDTSDVYTVTNYTGIGDAGHLAAQISVYPNPASDLLFVKSPVRVHLAITDIAGKVLIQSGNAPDLSVKELAAGVYFLRITDKDGNILKTEKIIRSR